MLRYLIVKNSRSVVEGKSYSGPTWDKAGLRECHQDSYNDHTEAMLIAKVLSEHNPVGFHVEEFKY